MNYGQLPLVFHVGLGGFQLPPQAHQSSLPESGRFGAVNTRGYVMGGRQNNSLTISVLNEQLVHQAQPVSAIPGTPSRVQNTIEAQTL